MLVSIDTSTEKPLPLCKGGFTEVDPKTEEKIEQKEDKSIFTKIMNYFNLNNRN